ncbi:cation diffusion facilitator family transporter [Rhizobacter sp. Root404]|uniref:cation diffusion facilitator family transporter n=1 Tax=Rhizobacter sp. Root404 TaxID=1736528 RepID=UPI0006F7D618|nr:cation diffusion facilitator family transporter [Rhizobacter sp. Root404]KQW36873.1 cation transporter [Rhizobacter sp. Root404]
MSAEHSEEKGHAGHDHATGANERSLKIALALTMAFLIVELVGGVVTKSLALISDAAHMFTDVAALAIALAAIRIAKRPADAKRTFGYHRFEILAAAFNAMLLFGVAVYILYEAYLRVKAPPEIQSTAMLVIAVVGLLVNLASMKVLASGQESSMNVKGAYLEVWADMIGSVGVIVGALVIKFTGWSWVDSLVAVGIGLWVVPRTWTLLKSSVNILLEGVPDDVDVEKVKETLLSVPGVISLHDLHVWAVTSGKSTLTAHLVTEEKVHAERDILPVVRDRLADQFGITHTTIQCEVTPCEQTDETNHFRSAAEGLKHDHRDDRS